MARILRIRGRKTGDWLQPFRHLWGGLSDFGFSILDFRLLIADG
jgi:hypothetical protein